MGFPGRVQLPSSPVQPWARRCSLLLVYLRWTLNSLSMFANQLMEMKRWSTGQRLLATCSFPQVYIAGDAYVQKGEIGLAWGRDGGDTCTNYQKRGGNEKAPKSQSVINVSPKLSTHVLMLQTRTIRFVKKCSRPLQYKCLLTFLQCMPR